MLPAKLHHVILTTALPIAAAAALFAAGISLAKPQRAASPVYRSAYAERGIVNVNKEGVAIQGHDPVACFTQSKAIKGKAQFSVAHDGATYYFASAENRATFQQEPARYIPAYGGYCGFGVAKNALARIDPTAFQIVDGRLILQYDADAMKEFNQDLKANIAKADANWKQMLDKRRK